MALTKQQIYYRGPKQQARRNSAAFRVAHNKNQRAHNARIRREALVIYSNGDVRCGCECGCGEDRELLLELDHINCDGSQHRQLLTGHRGAGGTAFYAALKARDWPTDPPLRVLCTNCNRGRERNNGRCPNLEFDLLKFCKPVNAAVRNQ